MAGPTGYGAAVPGPNLRDKLWWVPFGEVPEVTAPQLLAMLASESPPQLLDVRSSAEWRAGHIAGAIHLPITSLRRKLPTLDLDPTRPVVTICLTAHRSIPAVRLLRAQGFTDARQLRGGMQAWWAARQPTTVETTTPRPRP